MKMKQIVMAGPRRSEIVKVDVPEINPDQLLVKVTYTGMCHSEWYPWSVAAAGEIFGHETVGVVEKCGGYPVFVKPARGGSSIGVSKAADEAAYREALDAAFALDEKVAVEEAITGVEVGCAIMGDAIHGTKMGEVDEIVITGDGFFRIHLEKDPGANTELRCPADLPADVMARVREAGRTVYEALGCSGFARVDLFVTPEGEVVFNEVNSTPGMTYYSRFPQMMRVAGHELGEVLAELIDTEMEN